MSKTQTSPHVIKYDHMWRCLDFRHPESQLTRNFMNFLPQHPHTITRHVPKFCDFWSSFEIYIIKNHINDTWMVMFRIKDIQTFGWVYGYSLKIHSQIWVSFFEWLYIIISYTYSSNLLFQKNAKKINWFMKYSKML